MKKLLFIIVMCLVATSSFAYIYYAEQVDNYTFEFNDIEKSSFKYIYLIVSNNYSEEQIKKNITMFVNDKKVNYSFWQDKGFVYGMNYYLFTPVDEKGKQMKLKDKYNQVRIIISDKVKNENWGYGPGVTSYSANGYPAGPLIKIENSFLIFPSDIKISD